MIVAGPGTGKTRTLTHRIAAAVAGRGTPPESWLAITFTRRAAQEMRERLARLLPGQARGVTVSTFHGLGLAILRECHQQAGLTAGFQVAGEQLVAAVAAEAAGSQRAAAQLLAAEDPAGRARLAQALATRDLVSFDGLLEEPVRLLGADPALAERLRVRWPFVCVDEYQDIDARQYELLRLLAGDGRGLTVIGDPDQAIYGFRGADVAFFQRFRDDFPGASIVELTRGYRCAPVILAGALQAVAPATLVPGRTLRPAGPSRAGLEASRIWFHEAADEHAEAAWIARAVDRLLGGASFHSLDTGRADGHAATALGLADIAVLYRTDAQAAALGQGLTRAGLPWQKRSHDLLARRPATAEIAGELRRAGPAGRPVTGRLQAAVGTLSQQAPLRGLTTVDIQAAGEVLAPLARRCGDDLERFLTEITVGAEADSLDPRADAVTLLTLHAAKGLEFEVVFLAGCERGLLPLWLPGGPPGRQRPGRRKAAAVRRHDPCPQPAVPDV
ncbi:MAG: ATP-dependent helicase, partial [Actinobacteria bacterium]|nr:ATP-dependent helicase [Actinomycetota bacterium]